MSELEILKLRAEIEELKKVKQFYIYLKKLFKPMPYLSLNELELEVLKSIANLKVFYVPEAFKVNLIFKGLREKKLIGVGRIYVKGEVKKVAYLTLRGESTYEYCFKEPSWYKFRVPREKLELYYPRGYYLEGFNFNNLAELLVGLSAVLARHKVVYVATSDWRCFIQKVLTLRKWLPEELLLYIRDLKKSKVKVYLVPSNHFL